MYIIVVLVLIKFVLVGSAAFKWISQRHLTP